MRTVKLLLVVTLSLLIAVSPFVFAAYENVTIYYNDELLDFSGAGAYYDAQAQCVMVPVRAFAGYIGADVEFDAETGAILLSIYNTSVELNLNSKDAIVNSSRRITLPTTPTIYEGVSYIPLEAVTKSLNIEFIWDIETFTAYLSLAKNYTLGLSADEVKLNYGVPVRSDRSEQGFDWYVYNEVSGELTMVGIENSSVVAYYLFGGDWELDCGLYCGMSVENANSLLRMQGYSSAVGPRSIAYTGEDEYIIAYLDADGEDVCAVLYEKLEYKDIFLMTDRVTSSLALQMHDLVNAYRTNLGYAPLALDPMLSNLAQAHGQDMAAEGYFGHVDSQGLSNSDRFNTAGYGDCYCSEAIAQAYRNSFEAFAGLLGSADYEALTTANFDNTGSSVVYDENSDGVLYYVQLFYASKD